MELRHIPKLVINLSSRPDRMDQFKKQIVYLEDHAKRIEGVEHAKAMLGIAQAHLNCIRLAKQNKWDKVLIMEDDVIFPAKEKTAAYLKEALHNAPEDWQVLLGGVYEVKRIQKTNDYWSKVGEFCSLHFYIIRESAYDTVLEYDKNHHIDRWVNKGGNKLNCYVANKFFALQSAGFSDNVRKRVDYSDRIQRFQVL